MFEDAEAAFGPAIPDNGITGYAVKADPEDGCSPMAPPPNATKFHGWTQTFIAVIRRSRREGDLPPLYSNCTFDVKVLNAQLAGFNAAIVYNWDSEHVFEMSGGPLSSMVRIPSVFVASSSGLAIIQQYSYEKNFTLTILPSDGLFDPTLYFLPFLVVAGASFVILLVFMVVRMCRDRRRAQRNRLTRADLRAFPTRKFRKGDPELARYECCAICLEDYVDNDRLRVLPCVHAYHSRCIDEWLLTKKRVCPVCKQPIRTRREIREEARRNAQSSGQATSTSNPPPVVANYPDEDLLDDSSNVNIDESTPLLHDNAAHHNAGDDDELLDTEARAAQTNEHENETLVEINEEHQSVAHVEMTNQAFESAEPAETRDQVDEHDEPEVKNVV